MKILQTKPIKQHLNREGWQMTNKLYAKDMYACRRQSGHNDCIRERARSKMERTLRRYWISQTPNNKAEISEANIDVGINTDEPSKLEIVTQKSRVSKKIKQATGSETYQLTFQNRPYALSRYDILYPVYCNIRKTNMIPTTWSGGIIIKLPKKKTPKNKKISQTARDVLLYSLYQERSLLK